MKTVALAAAALIAATMLANAQTPVAQQTAPHPASQVAPPSMPASDMPPPPPPPGGPRGPRADHFPPPPPPPPPGASIRLDRGLDGGVHVDVHCADRDSTKECADTASQLLDKLSSMGKTK